jgi:competence protein ComEC
MNKKKYAYVFLVILCLFNHYFPPRSRDLNIYFLDVGQGDSILVITPQDKRILIDTGPDRSSLVQLSRYFPPQDRRLDYLIITHSDYDHAAMSEELEREFKVGNTISGFDDFKDLPQRSLLFESGISISFLWPDKEAKMDTNKDSIAFLLSFGQWDMFCAGDLPAAEEEVVSASLRQKVELLKISHHGSKNSTSEVLINKLQPDFAVISVGRDNSYGHPDQRVLDLLIRYSIETLRTDRDSTLHFNINGSGRVTVSRLL